MRRITGLAITLLAFNLHAEPFATTPVDVCQWMSNEIAGGTSKYHQQGKDLYRCASYRMKINRGEPVLSSVRFVANGTENTVDEVRLEMRMYSFAHPQQALKRFQGYANSLSEKALAVALPEEIGNSLMAGTVGEWQVAGRTVSLQRLWDHGSSYDFYFRIY